MKNTLNLKRKHTTCNPNLYAYPWDIKKGGLIDINTMATFYLPPLPPVIGICRLW